MYHNMDVTFKYGPLPSAWEDWQSLGAYVWNTVLMLGTQKQTRHLQVSNSSQCKMAPDGTLSKRSHVHIYMYRTGKCKKSQTQCFLWSFSFTSFKLKSKVPWFFCLPNAQMILISCPSLAFFLFVVVVFYAGALPRYIFSQRRPPCNILENLSYRVFRKRL